MQASVGQDLAAVPVESVIMRPMGREGQEGQEGVQASPYAKRVHCWPDLRQRALHAADTA